MSLLFWSVAGEFPLAPSLCVLWATMDVLMCTASIWHMCTMSMDRYFTLKYPMKYGRNKTKMMVAMKITFVWVVSTAICSPICIMGFVDYDHVYDYELSLCTPNIPNFVIYGSVFAFYVPLCIMVMTYLLTTRILRTNQKLMKYLTHEQKGPKIETHANGRIRNNSHMKNVSNLATMSLPVSRYIEGSRETSISERASIHETEDNLERTSQTTSPHRQKTTSIDYTTSPVSNSTEKIPAVTEPDNTQQSKYQFHPLSPMSLNFAIGENQAQGIMTGIPALSVSQPHLPSLDNENTYNEHKQLVPSKSHNILSSSQLQKSQLSVNALESVKNFDSLLSLNSVLSKNWGSEAWSDFDDPAMFERLSHIEAEMDDCLVKPSKGERNRSRLNMDAVIQSTSDADSASFLGVDSPLSNSVFTPKCPNKAVFLYPGTNPDSPGYECGNTDSTHRGTLNDHSRSQHRGSNTSLSPTGYMSSHRSAGDDFNCTSPLSLRGDAANVKTGCDTFIHRPNSPAIMIEDTSCDPTVAIPGNGSETRGYSLCKDFTHDSTCNAMVNANDNVPLIASRIMSYSKAVYSNNELNVNMYNPSPSPPERQDVLCSSKKRNLPYVDSQQVKGSFQSSRKRVGVCSPTTPSALYSPTHSPEHRTLCVNGEGIPIMDAPSSFSHPDLSTYQDGSYYKRQSADKIKESNVSAPTRTERQVTGPGSHLSSPSHQSSFSAARTERKVTGPGSNLSSPSHQSSFSSASQHNSPCSPSRQLLQLDLDTLIITPNISVGPVVNPVSTLAQLSTPTVTVDPVTTPVATVAPVTTPSMITTPSITTPAVPTPAIITTSPASSRSQTSPVNLVESPASSKSGLITIQLQPKGCYMYKLGDSQSDNLSSQVNDDRSKVDSDNLGYMDHRVVDPNHLHANGYLKGGETDSLSPTGSYGQLMQCHSPSLVDTELVSQEVERSTDDTLSDHLSYSTTSTSRHHIPSLSVHWSGKGHGIQLKTFLRQVSFRRSRCKEGELTSKQVLSKRTANNEKKASKVLGIIFAVFVILWSPFFIVNIVYVICVPCQESITPPIVASLVWLGYLSSLANPIIYTMFNTSFRRAFINIITCKLKRRNARQSTHESRHVSRRRKNAMYQSTYTSERRSNTFHRT